MSTDPQVIQLLTELRDIAREESVYRKRAIDESLRLSRQGVRMQRIGLVIVFVLIPLVGLGVTLALSLTPAK